MRSTDRAAFACAACGHGEFDLWAFLSRALYFGVEQNVDAILLEDRQNFSGDVRIFAADQLRSSLRDGHAAAKAAEKLAEFKPDIAAADDQEMLGDGVEFHDGRAVEIRNAFETFERRHGRAAPGVDKKFIGGERALRAILKADLNRAGAREAGLAKEQIEIGSLFDPRLNAVTESGDDRALALPDAAHVHGDAAGVNSVVRSTTGQIGDAAARDYRFRGSTALVDACAAHVRAFHQSGAQAGISQCLAERRACLAGADDGGLIMVGYAHRCSSAF